MQAYCQERGNRVDPQRWHDHYLSNDWHVGRSRMRDWRAAVRTWERNHFERQGRTGAMALGQVLHEHGEATFDA